MAKQFYAAKYAELFHFHDPLSIIGSIFWNWSEADRFDILNKYSPYNFVVDKSLPLPNLNPEKDIDIKQAVSLRANSILQKARRNNKKIVVLWSGGVDSTCIISSFVLAGIKQDELVIFCTPESINEYQKGYYDLKYKFKYNMYMYEWVDSVKAYDDFKDDAYFITGWCADQLFGSNVNQAYPELYRSYWKDAFKIIIKDSFNSTFPNGNIPTKEEEIDNALDQFDIYAKKLGLKIKYTCDALWLFNFGIKWSHVSRDFKLTIRNPEQQKNVINFYDIIQLQEWSLENYQDFHKNNQATEVKTYKRPLKEISYEVFKDKNFLENKGKFNSWNSLLASIQFSDMAIWDTEEGIKMYDFYDLPDYIKEKNPSQKGIFRYQRRRHMAPYLKDFIDQDRYINTLNFW